MPLNGPLLLLLLLLNPWAKLPRTGLQQRFSVLLSLAFFGVGECLFVWLPGGVTPAASYTPGNPNFLHVARKTSQLLSRSHCHQLCHCHKEPICLLTNRFSSSHRLIHADPCWLCMVSLQGHGSATGCTWRARCVQCPCTPFPPPQCPTAPCTPSSQHQIPSRHGLNMAK